tara:strand:- start:1632 stop:2708 length:1077 start_codon:yes stop_codon:yes gene_type:complete
MPELRSESYDENKGEWFPYHDDENPNTRSRAMYFFHNSLGEVTQNEQIKFVDTVTTGGGGGDGSGSWNGPEDDIQSWPIKDLSDLPIDTYSDGSPCYRYRFNWSNNNQQHTRLRVGVWRAPVNPTENDTIIYNRYINALKFIFGPDNASVKLTQIEDSNQFFEGIDEVFPFDDIVNFPVFNEDAGIDGGATDYNIEERVALGSEILVKANELLGSDGNPRLPNKNIGGVGGINSGVITWNAVPKSSGGSNPETQTGQFMVGDIVENYNAGDYLLLEAVDDENHFHDRVVFVRSSSFQNTDEEQVIEIQLLDDEGFASQEQEPFTITKLTNAPKLKVKYKINSSSNRNFNIQDDVEDLD